MELFGGINSHLWVIMSELVYEQRDLIQIRGGVRFAFHFTPTPRLSRLTHCNNDLN
jgi:hypothetical protein